MTALRAHANPPPMLDLRPVGYVLGLLTVVMGVAMLFPMAIDLADGNRNWQAFAVSAAVAMALGAVWRWLRPISTCAR